ncbi:MAG: 50S ribosomal protein L18 [Nanoarchaeota archaeon]|jgi:large subunit ribosomal protein L18|nr:50S ribosomal protein L18 [Nanoarchaeota archaeon]
MKMKKMQRRRRMEKKTNYTSRVKLLKSDRPRLVFRKTNSYVIVQYVNSFEAQDSMIFGLTSKALLKYGWPEEFKGSLKSITASYLTGYLTAKKILKENLEQPIVDFGMQRTLHKTKLFAFLKGAIDGGLEISCSEEAFPEQERIEGKSLKNDFSSKFSEIKTKIDKL